MNEIEITSRLEVAIDAVRAGGAIALAKFKDLSSLVIEHKGVQDLVSDADRAVEAAIRARLSASFPDDGLLGEEEGGVEAHRLWVIDPIDGTANYLRGIPYWCVVMAFVIDGDPMLGLTYDPVHDHLFIARSGRGATCNGQPIAVSARPVVDACLGLSYSFKTDPLAYQDLIGRLLAEKLDHRRMGSSALSLAHVAEGRLEGLACLSCNSWDVLAGLLLVQEAGGAATRYVEGSTLLDRRAVAAAAPQLARTVMDLIGHPLHAALTGLAPAPFEVGTGATG